MNAVLTSLISTLLVTFRSRLVLQAEILALRHQLNVIQRSAHSRRRLRLSDRIFWVWLSRLWTDWRSALLIVKPETSFVGIVWAFAFIGAGRAAAQDDRILNERSEN
jgi:hypothetical protein